MEKKVAAFCRQNELLLRGDRVLVGLSGGADSVCLFLVLMAMKNEWELDVVPVHVHHNLRGAEADADERFCEMLCGEYGLSLVKVSVPVAKLAKENGWTVEEAGRNARYETFARLKKEMDCDRIAVAHHKNDQAETMLFQLLRGSRLKGLSGMEAKREELIRPLLCVTREEIERYLEKKNQSFCIDRTNLEEDYTRNRIRNKLMPLAVGLQERAVEHIADTAEYLLRVENYLEQQTQNCYAQAVMEEKGQYRISIDKLKETEPLLAERVIYRVLCGAAGAKKDLTATAVKQCVELMEKQTGRRITLPFGLIAIREYDVIRIYKEQEEQPETEVLADCFPFIYDLPENAGRLTMELWEVPGESAEFIEKMGGIPKSNYTKWYDYDTINSDVSLRTPKSGDRISLYADGRGKSVSDVLTDAKIPKEKRERMPLLAAGNQVLWIFGVRSSEAFRVTENTRRILAVTIEAKEEKEREEDGR